MEKARSHSGGSGNLYDRIVRLYRIESLLSGRGHVRKRAYTVYDIWEAVGEDTVTLKTVRNDMALLQEIAECDLFGNEFRIEQTKVGKMTGYYINPESSLFRRNFSTDELEILSDLIETIGKFNGVSGFENFGKLRPRSHKGGASSGSPSIVDLNIRPHRDGTLFARLFKAISDGVVIRLKYRPLSHLNDADRTTGVKEETVRPFQIKRFGNRWVLIAAVESDRFICNFSFEQIVDFAEVTDGVNARRFMTYERKRVEHLFDYAIGPTMPRELCLLKPDKDEHLSEGEEYGKEQIYVYVFADRANHFASFPIIDNGTQHEVATDSEIGRELMRYHADLPADGRIFTFVCYPYRELAEAIMGRMDSVVVLRPESLRKEIAERVKRLGGLYGMGECSYKN